MSLDGAWIRKNEAREYSEGPFESLDVARDKISDKYFDLRIRLSKMAENIEKYDNFIPVDSVLRTFLKEIQDESEKYDDFWESDDYKYLKNCNDFFDDLLQKIHYLEVEFEKFADENIPEIYEYKRALESINKKIGLVKSMIRELELKIDDFDSRIKLYKFGTRISLMNYEIKTDFNKKMTIDEFLQMEAKVDKMLSAIIDMKNLIEQKASENDEKKGITI